MEGKAVFSALCAAHTKWKTGSNFKNVSRFQPTTHFPTTRSCIVFFRSKVEIIYSLAEMCQNAFTATKLRSVYRIHRETTSVSSTERRDFSAEIKAKSGIPVQILGTFSPFLCFIPSSRVSFKPIDVVAPLCRDGICRHSENSYVLQRAWYLETRYCTRTRVSHIIIRTRAGSAPTDRHIHLVSWSKRITRRRRDLH